MAIYLEPDDWERFAALAKAEGRSYSQMGARLVVQGLGAAVPEAPVKPRGPLVPVRTPVAEPVLEPVES